ncbi:uncharacterized protein G2W53_033512 [Senna tora]|uniref:Uncharacterized protein n=1 Tax=Senna tora TaxID=362788 RepID=A0A834T1F3_9FABA|nr:uncharacterized protein G2W53_033512 [Senna tora]
MPDPGASFSRPSMLSFKADDYSCTFRVSWHELEGSGFFIRGLDIGHVLSLKINFIVSVGCNLVLILLAMITFFVPRRFLSEGTFPVAYRQWFFPFCAPDLSPCRGDFWHFSMELFCACRFDSMHDYVQTL